MKWMLLAALLVASCSPAKPAAPPPADAATVVEPPRPPERPLKKVPGPTLGDPALGNRLGPVGTDCRLHDWGDCLSGLCLTLGEHRWACTAPCGLPGTSCAEGWNCRPIPNRPKSPGICSPPPGFKPTPGPKP